MFSSSGALTTTCTAEVLSHCQLIYRVPDYFEFVLLPRDMSLFHFLTIAEVGSGHQYNHNFSSVSEK